MSAGEETTLGRESAGSPAPGSNGWSQTSGLRRERLLERLRSPAHLTLVLAPAGCGKTTLLAQYSDEAPSPIVWHRTDRLDADPAHFTTRLAHGLLKGSALREIQETATAPGGFDRFLDTLRAAEPGPVTLVIDDAHLLIGSPTENCIEALLGHIPGVSVILASRRALHLNLCRMEITPITLVTADDLRFRSWEVEVLFRDVYREPLPPDDIAALARRTEGWAACLQLFHLSTQSRPLSERRQALRALAGGPRFVRTYLARTVLEELPQRLRTFLTRTCVFELLTARRCNRLLDTADAQQRLEELEGLGALTTSTDGGQTFRYHEVLRRHLEGALVDELGAKATQLWYSKTASLLEDSGAIGEAVRAHLRAECWTEATRLLREDGARVIAAEPSTVWHDLVPQQMVDEDPWLSMAVARRLAAEGRLRESVQRYRHAETLFPDPADRQRAVWHRRLVELWIEGRAQPQLHWSDRLRAAVHRHPGSNLTGQTPGDQLCAAIGSLLAGDLRAACVPLRDLLDHPDTDGMLALAARLVQAAIDLAFGATENGSAERLATDAERIGALWLARQARVMSALRAGDVEEVQRVVAECDGAGDAWGTLLASAAQALRQLLGGEPAQAAWHDVVARCRALGAGSLEAWALAFAALAAAGQGDPEAAAMARHAESFSRTAGVWGAQALTALALAATDPRSQVGHLQQARALAETHGLPWPEMLAARLLGSALPPARPVVVGAASPAVRLRCLGGFAFEVVGRSLDWGGLDWGGVRPRAATMLRLLAIHLPLPVHRELLLQLWPDLSTDRAVRSMQVAVSSLRALLAPELPGCSFGTLERHGDAYLLVLPPGSEADVVEFATQIQAAAQARHARDAEVERAALAGAVAAYRGELLPEDGPAEWVIDARERLRQQAATATGRLADLELAGGDLQSAIDAARRSVEIDPFRDASWRVLIAACTQAGEPAAAARARRDYAEVLSTLDIPDLSAKHSIPMSRSRPPAPVSTR